MDTQELINKKEQAALMLRLGLGAVFLIGGVSKLSLLLNSATHDAMVNSYMGTTGYINSLFQQYLFTGNMGELITPSLFLTSLSTFELLSGIALIAGFMVRPLALIYAFLLWSFVVSLPVMTVPGVEIDVKTYTSPAIFVQIRDIALSGLMFTLFNLGAGSKSIDSRLIAPQDAVNWNNLGLLLRLSMGILFVVSGFFGEFSKVPNFATWQPLMAILGVVLIFGSDKFVRAAGAVIITIMVWYIFHKLSADKGVIANLNSFKREFALGAAGGVLLLLGGGALFTARDLLTRGQSYLNSIFKRAKLA